MRLFYLNVFRLIALLALICFEANAKSVSRDLVQLKLEVSGFMSVNLDETNSTLKNCFGRDSSEAVTTQSKLDWDYVDDLAKLDSCIFLMAERLADKDTLNAWLEGNGFSITAPQKIPQNVMITSYNRDLSGWRLNGTQAKPNIKIKMGLLERHFIHSISIGVILDANHAPLSVRSIFNRI